MKLSVVVPAYNEEKRLPKTLGEIDRYLRTQAYPYEIIVVNDGSKDSTASVVRSLDSSIPNLRLVDNPVNRGKGYAVRQGLLEAKGEYRLFMDADNSTTIEQVEKMWPAFQQGWEVVIGSRDVEGAVMDPPQPFFRRFLGDIFNLLVQAIVGLWGIYDTQCGFKAFTARAARDIFPLARIDRWAFDVEILMIARAQGYKIKEVPVFWRNDLESKVKLKGMVNMLLEVAQVRWNMLRSRYRS